MEQCAHRWRAVNAKLLTNRASVGLLLSYASLCHDPAAALRRIAEGAGIPVSALRLDLPELNSSTANTRRVSIPVEEPLLRRATLDPDPRAEPIEVGPLSPAELCVINEICSSLAAELTGR